MTNGVVNAAKPFPLLTEPQIRRVKRSAYLVGCFTEGLLAWLGMKR